MLTKDNTRKFCGVIRFVGNDGESNLPINYLLEMHRDLFYCMQVNLVEEFTGELLSVYLLFNFVASSSTRSLIFKLFIYFKQLSLP